MGLTLAKYQREAGKMAEYGSGWEYPLLGLGGEVGEIQNKMKKILRGDYQIEGIQPSLIKELGDVLWYVAQLCTELGFSLEVVADINIEKLADRKERDKIKGSGDDR